MADESTNQQINHDSTVNPLASKDEKIDSLADDMAVKAGKVQKSHESTDTVGGVRSNSGGIFSK